MCRKHHKAHERNEQHGKEGANRQNNSTVRKKKKQGITEISVLSHPIGGVVAGYVSMGGWPPIMKKNN